MQTSVFIYNLTEEKLLSHITHEKKNQQNIT